MLAALNAYLTHASTAGLVTYASLGLLTLGLGPFAVFAVIDHMSVARRVSQGVR